jgi:hypothetical protein
MSIPELLTKRSEAEIQLVASTPLQKTAMPMLLRAQRPTQQQLVVTVKDIMQGIINTTAFYYFPASLHAEKKLKLQMDYLGNKDLARCRVVLRDTSIADPKKQIIVEIYPRFVPTNALVSDSSCQYVLRAFDAPRVPFAQYILKAIENEGVRLKKLVVLDLQNLQLSGQSSAASCCSGSSTGETLVDYLNYSSKSSGSTTLVTSKPPPQVVGAFDLSTYMITSSVHLGVDTDGDGEPDDENGEDTGSADGTLIQYSAEAQDGLFREMILLQDAIRAVSQCNILSISGAPTSTASPRVLQKPTQLFTEDFIGELANGIPGDSFNIPLIPIKMENQFDGVAMLARYKELKAQLEAGNLTAADADALTLQKQQLGALLGNELADGTFDGTGSQVQNECLIVEMDDPSNNNSDATDNGDGDDAFTTHIPIADLGGFGHCVTVTFNSATGRFVVGNYKLYHNEDTPVVQCKLNILSESVWSLFQHKIKTAFPREQVETVFQHC